MENKFLNYLKGIGCISVVLIHAVIPGKIGIAIKTLADFAVPIFFMISGYYAYDDNQSQSRVKIKRRMKRIFKITIYALLIYFVFSMIYLLIMEGICNTGQWFLQCFSINILAKIVLLNNFDFLNAWHLWFLLALIYDYILLILFNKVSKEKYHYVYMLIPLCFSIRVFLCNRNPLWINNFFITGLPFILLGNMIAKYEKKFREILEFKVLGIAVGIGAGWSLIMLKNKLIIDFSYMGIIVMSLSLFIMALMKPEWGDNIIAVIGKKYSLSIYIIHLMVMITLTQITEEIHLEKNVIIQYITSIIVIILSILASVLYRKIIINIKNKKEICD